MRNGIIMDEGDWWNVTAIVLYIIVAVVISVCCGCCNIMTRTDNRTSPYACAPHPYYCTWEDLNVLAAPFSEPTGPEGSIAKAYATVFSPVFLVDLPFEIALDTVFFPVDAVWYWGVKEGR